MLVDNIGEFGLIERFRKLLKTDSSVIKGSGDDCAVIKFDKARYLLFTCDMLVEGMDFLSNENPYLIGRKAVASSISDIAACAGLPRYALVSLGIPKKTSVRFIDKLFRGMLTLCKKYKINLVGGDVSEADKLTIDVSMLGVVEKKNLALRCGAKKNDIIFVTGELGGAIYGKHLRFTPRIKEARFLIRNFKINSMIDISDGLTQDLGHILKESSAGAVIYEELIPLSEKAANLDDALYTGEDFELLFTMSCKEAKRLMARNPLHFRPIGEITEKKYGLKLVDKEGKEKAVSPKGFTHF